MKKEELYKAVLRAIKNQDPNVKSCYNCIVHFIKAELNKLSFYDYKGYHKDSCSSPLLYLENLGIIKILGKNPNNSACVDCYPEIKILHKGNKI